MQIRIPEPVPPGLTVIETMRAEAGQIALLPLHLDRLRRDCAAVGFTLDEDAVAALLAEIPQAGVLRLRLTVDAAGPQVTHQSLAPNPDLWRLAISEVMLNSADPWLRIKTSHRPAYEAARASMPKGCDEAILLNEREEVCEGTITNLFLMRGDRLLTPPLCCGLLPGVLRASLLAEGRVEEAVLRRDDLIDGTLYCGNALRGLIPARLV